MVTFQSFVLPNLFPSCNVYISPSNEPKEALSNIYKVHSHASGRFFFLQLSIIAEQIGSEVIKQFLLINIFKFKSSSSTSVNKEFNVFIRIGFPYSDHSKIGLMGAYQFPNTLSILLPLFFILVDLKPRMICFNE